jgi:hypothetical protein
MRITRRKFVEGPALCAGAIKLIPLPGCSYINTLQINKGVI